MTSLRNAFHGSLQQDNEELVGIVDASDTDFNQTQCRNKSVHNFLLVFTLD